MLDYVTLATIGMSLAIVGVIFLANAMGIRRPRRFIQEFFGIKRTQHLRTVLDQLRAKAEIFVGFLFLMVGFSLQIVAELSPSFGPMPVPGPEMMRLQLQAFLTLAAGVLVLTVVLRLMCRAWSVALFRNLLTEFFREHHDWRFENHPAVTREIGEILAIPSREDDSISDYAARVRSALGLAPLTSRRRVPDDAFLPVPKVDVPNRG
ncbi:MAG: hypothetical protein ACYTG2_12975 [Planctomycetota bacterium]